MKYCKRCIMPDTRPGLVLDDEGVCNACRWQESKTLIDWEAHRSQLQGIADQARTNTYGSWDCVVGVSGGKDSTWQALFLRDEIGLNPLLVSYVGPDVTEIGRNNINNLSNLGFDVLSLKPNPRIARLLSKKSFYDFGNLVKYSDSALFPVPFRAAMAYKIPLVFFGENAAMEAGDKNTQGEGWDATKVINNNTLSGHGTDIWVREDVTEKDLIPYRYPSVEEFKDWGGKGIFMG
ncbi:MAG: N-acetyl sugar amidotransferase, partial [Thermodesulfobacteriota bacterium]|nr:N-acetyl sugar amidotransferase [Thermodesulfobacteriota bacterium]